MIRLFCFVLAICLFVPLWFLTETSSWDTKFDATLYLFVFCLPVSGALLSYAFLGRYVPDSIHPDH
jgi:hypothetical protein